MLFLNRIDIHELDTKIAYIFPILSTTQANTPRYNDISQLKVFYCITKY